MLLLAPPPSIQVAGRTNDSAGDGTTTASVLAREMIHFGLQVGIQQGGGRRLPVWVGWALRVECQHSGSSFVQAVVSGRYG